MVITIRMMMTMINLIVIAMMIIDDVGCRVFQLHPSVVTTIIISTVTIPPPPRISEAGAIGESNSYVHLLVAFRWAAIIYFLAL